MSLDLLPRAHAAAGRAAVAAAQLREDAARIAFPPVESGEVRAFDGLLVTIEGLVAGPGVLLEVEADPAPVAAEVIGFRRGSLLAMAMARGAIRPGGRARRSGRADLVAFGPELLGRVVDAMGRPVDGGRPIRCAAATPLDGRALPPLDRADVCAPVETGVRAIDALFTLGRGQRIGLIAGTGVGKSTLMRDLVFGIRADVTVVALVGERGREISGMVDSLGSRSCCHIIAVPADEAAPLRVRGARRALAVAEGFRATGAHVLLVMDSLTRAAHAQREIGLAAGEPAGTRGYPASALALLPRLIERAGGDRASGGAITAVFTLLADGDDLVADPVVDTARGVLDGHIVLTRELAARGRLPAIDTGASVSRTMAACVAPAHLAAASAFLRDAALVEANRDLRVMGAYVPGQDMTLDQAMARAEAIEEFLIQPPGSPAPFAASIAQLIETWGDPGAENGD
ncbi:flagellum-specific ATP synthase FliI [Thermaurantiacus sp.]